MDDRPSSVSLFAIGRRAFMCIVGLGFSANALCQSPPVDLPDLSLAELLEVEMTGDDSANRWRFAYEYSQVRFEGYRDGTERVSNASLLHLTPPPPEPETFLVLPTTIVQEAHSLSVSFDLGRRTRLGVVLPFIHQTTDHISSVPGYGAFTIDSSGFGDVPLSVSHELWAEGAQSLSLRGGLLFPVGSIDEKGDTPRPPPGNDDQLPYTMQIGSGTWDLLLVASYRGSRETTGWLGRVDWGVSLSAKLRTGRNDRDYRLGNLYTVAARMRATPKDWLRPNLELSALAWDRIAGEDTELRVPNVNGFFPAPVTDPALFGGEKVVLSIGLELGWPADLVERWGLAGGAARFVAGQALILQFGAPVYQRLHGPQPEQDWQLNLGLRVNF